MTKSIDLTGKRFDKLVVLNKIPRIKNSLGACKYLCKCDCGKEVIRNGSHLRDPGFLTQSCGCSTTNKLKNKAIVGKRFGKLLVVEEIEGQGPILLRCLCDCGNYKNVEIINLRSGNTNSCGCLRGIDKITHGATNTTEYNAWHAMIQRCNYPKYPRYSNWGGRGIKVCDQWVRPQTGFIQFLKDVGNRPGPDYSLDRKNNDGDYTPENTRWATRIEQNTNRHKHAAIYNFTDDELLNEFYRRHLDSGLRLLGC